MQACQEADAHGYRWERPDQQQLHRGGRVLRPGHQGVGVHAVHGDYPPPPLLHESLPLPSSCPFALSALHACACAHVSRSRGGRPFARRGLAAAAIKGRMYLVGGQYSGAYSVFLRARGTQSRRHVPAADLLRKGAGGGRASCALLSSRAPQPPAGHGGAHLLPVPPERHGAELRGPHG